MASSLKPLARKRRHHQHTPSVRNRPSGRCLRNHRPHNGHQDTGGGKRSAHQRSPQNPRTGRNRRRSHRSRTRALRNSANNTFHQCRRLEEQGIDPTFFHIHPDHTRVVPVPGTNMGSRRRGCGRSRRSLPTMPPYNSRVAARRHTPRTHSHRNPACPWGHNQEGGRHHSSRLVHRDMFHMSAHNHHPHIGDSYSRTASTCGRGTRSRCWRGNRRKHLHSHRRHRPPYDSLARKPSDKQWLHSPACRSLRKSGPTQRCNSMDQHRTRTLRTDTRDSQHGRPNRIPARTRQTH